MQSLQDLDAHVLAKIAGRCDLESAARLSLVNKHVYGVVKPVLPWLCDTKDLQLLLPHKAHDVEYQRTCWGLAFAKGDEYLQVAVSTKKCDGQYYLVQYDNADEDADLCIPFDRSGQYNPQMRQMRQVEFFSHAISGPQRPGELDQRVINTVLRGAKRNLSSKKALYTVRKYLKLKRHQTQSVSVRHVAKDVQYVSMVFSLPAWVDIRKFAPRPVAQKRLLDYIENEPPDNWLEQLGDNKDDVTIVGATLCEASQWGEPTDHCEYLAEVFFKR